MVTIAVRLPAALGFVVKLTVRVVAVADVTVPTAPLLNCTVLLDAVVASNPKPLIVIVDELAARLAVLLVTAGLTVATCTAEPLFCVFVVTTAVRLPIVSGDVSKPTVMAVFVDETTVPTAPLLNTTVLLPAVVENPKPAITIVAAFAAMLAVLLVTTGVTAAT